MNLKKFGAGHLGDDYGYDLGLCVGWLEAMVDQESDFVQSRCGPRYKRLGLVQDALEKLQEAMEMSDKE